MPIYAAVILVAVFVYFGHVILERDTDIPAAGINDERIATKGS